jgi:superfamily II DNA/RNA helicase
VLTIAQSGTGKTATFSISILQTINTTQRETQALVLSPTRELATQIQSVILALGEYLNVWLRSLHANFRCNATRVLEAPTSAKTSAS